CVQKGNIDQCINFIESDRSVLKQKGWGGFTPLHYAALHGNRALVDLFLSNGADPNLTCDAGQTSFHFACRQGNIYIIHQMMQYGADLRVIDLQGKSSLHHAVTGGNIAVHYLWETGMFRFSDADMYQVTPLHLAASTGNTEMICYLLKEGRCAVDAVDHQGATALHVAAERGGVEVCWILLQRTGCGMIHLKNHSGLTPLDLSRQGTTFVLYYWTLLFPTVSGAAILLIAAMLGSYGGLICCLLFPWLAKSIFLQYHRMTTHLLPNPVYLGTLIAGMFHSLLCFYGKLMPVWSNSALLHVTIVHFAIVLILFFRVLAKDPGTLHRADADSRLSCIADLVENNQSPQRFCPYCEPDFTKHCKLCEACIKEYDHHCLFLNQCVGQGNHRLFLFFILSMVIAHLLFAATAANYLFKKVPSGGHSLSLWLTLLGEEFWVAVMMVMNVLTLLWEVWLLTEQFEAVSTGGTTYFRRCESSDRRRSLWQRSLVFLSFLLDG
uniref:Palmitoyltransferase n=1 Tax=Cynoglossus semilaevis TaxID=244447 RepID=A0A3P8VBS8_CYNSE